MPEREARDDDVQARPARSAASVSVRPVNALVRCPSCNSGLIAPTQADECSDGVVVRRRCPECGHRDRLVATRFAAAVWARHETRISSRLQGLADALADGAPLDVSELFRV